jgi:thiol-disulfide isomerase/thioredoxin
MSKRQIANLIVLSALSAQAQSVYDTMKKSKGKNFTSETLAEKLPETDEKELTAAITSLVDSGLIEKNTDKDDAFLGYVFPKAESTALAAEADNTIGGKSHTSRTANSNLVIYQGETVAFKAHTLSPEAKAGQLVQFGTVRRTHLNEQGFQYFNLDKLNAEGEKVGTCAKKSSGIILVDENNQPYADPSSAPIPEGVKAVIGLKKAAGLEKPSTVDCAPIDVESMKGSAVIVFTGEGSPASRAMQSTIEKVVAEYSGSILVVEVDAYWNARLAAQMAVREVPTVVAIKDGSVSDRISGTTSEEDLSKFFAAAVKSQGKTATLSELPYVEAAVEEPTAEAEAESSEDSSSEEAAE